MKLLLDEMWSAALAEQLRRRGHDVVAVKERPDLRGQTDAIVFSTAQAEQRVIVTENVADFRLLALNELQHGRTHVGLIFTTNSRYFRHDSRTAGRFVAALDRMLTEGAIAAGTAFWLS